MCETYAFLIGERYARRAPPIEPFATVTGEPDPLTTEKLCPAMSALVREMKPPACATALAAVVGPLTGLVDVA